MNSHLNSALAELKQAGAENLPSAVSIEAAEDGSEWSGKTKSGDHWELIKNHSDSYNVTCEAL